MTPDLINIMKLLSKIKSSLIPVSYYIKSRTKLQGIHCGHFRDEYTDYGLVRYIRVTDDTFFVVTRNRDDIKRDVFNAERNLQWAKRALEEWDEHSEH